MRTFHLGLIVMMMALGAPALSLFVGTLAGLISSAAGYIAGSVVLLVVEFALVVRLLSIVRATAWLDGSILTVRTALATRSCDLALASGVVVQWKSEMTQVSGADGTIATVPTGRKIPLLWVRGESGRPMRLTLVDPGTRRLLEAPALAALAGAIQSGGQRPGRDTAVLQSVVAELHAMATGSPQRN